MWHHRLIFHFPVFSVIFLMLLWFILSKRKSLLLFQKAVWLWCGRAHLMIHINTRFAAFFIAVFLFLIAIAYGSTVLDNMKKILQVVYWFITSWNDNRHHHLWFSQARHSFFSANIHVWDFSVLMGRFHTMFTRWTMENNWINSHRTSVVHIRMRKTNKF